MGGLLWYNQNHAISYNDTWITSETSIHTSKLRLKYQHEFIHSAAKTMETHIHFVYGHEQILRHEGSIEVVGDDKVKLPQRSEWERTFYTQTGPQSGTHMDPTQMKTLVLGGWYLDMAQEGSLASVFDSIPMLQPQSYTIKEWTTENTDTRYQKRDH